jgi:FlaA1/EpsC-like NDP-sugar epimerase
MVRDWLGMGVEGGEVRESINWVLVHRGAVHSAGTRVFRVLRRIRSKSTGQAIMQIFKALVIIALMIGMFAIFAQAVDTRRLVLGIGFMMVFFLVLIRDRADLMWLKRQSHLQTDAKERVMHGRGRRGNG